MKWKLTGLAGALAVVLHLQPVAPADACGVKLTVKPSGPKKAVARSSRPSQVLLLGTHPRKLERELSSAGHSVEVAPTAGAAKRKAYAVVVVDNSKADEARTSFPGAVVMVRSGDVTADIRSVEGHVARKPVGADGREVVAAKRDRDPVAAGPEPRDAKKVVATREPVEPVAAPPPPRPEPRPEPKVEPKVEPKIEKAPTPKPVETASVEPKPEVTPPRPEPKKVVATPRSAFRSEVHFVFAGWGLSRGVKNQLDETARWLAENSDIKVSIEGHADPTGTSEANMTLSQARAAAVEKYLVANGVDASRLETVGHGDTKLKYGRTDNRNRRVEIIKK